MIAANDAAPGDRFVADLLSYMTLGEKLGQLDLFRSEDDPTLEQAIVLGEVGGVASAARAARWQSLAVERSRLGIPLLFTGNPLNRELSPWALAASWDETLAEEIGRRVGRAALESGGNALRAPHCTSSKRPLDGIFDIAACEPHLAARMVAAFCRGTSLHGADPRSAVLGMAQITGQDEETERLTSLALTHETDVVAIDSPSLDFQAARRAGFDGLLVAECRRLQTLVSRHFAETRARSLLESTERAIETGKLREDEIDAAVRGVLNAKHALGLFRDPQRILPPTVTATGFVRPVERVRSTMILLRNEAGTLPFSPVSDRVLVIGDPDGAAGVCADALGRGGIGHVAAPGLALRRNGEPWTEPIAGDHFALALTRDAAKRCDFLLVVLEDKHFVRQQKDTWQVPGAATMAMLRTLAAVGPRIVGIVATSEPVDLADADQHFAAVLQSWAPSEGTAEALGEILSGRWSPQGRMPVTAGRFAFGHGLGFAESNLTGYALRAEAGRVAASITVRNPGCFAISETVQVFRRLADGTLRLIDFCKLTVTPGQQSQVRFELGLEALGTPGHSGRFELSPGRAEICIGKDIRRVLTADIEISPAIARAIVNRESGYLRLAG